MQAYLATFVRRWHTHPYLNTTNDCLAAHGGRMCVLALDLFPGPSRKLLAACVTHDLGEAVTGDVPYNSPIKNAYTEEIARINMGMAVVLDPDDELRLNFLDILDSYLWARHHAPWLMRRKDWQDQRKNILDIASRLGVSLVSYDI
jgi:5'-deoxynucleotidase YfbR-like HD superfamily hydrolase